jgi:hypothetical protein
MAFGPTPWIFSRSFAVTVVSSSYRVYPLSANTRRAVLPIAAGNSVGTGASWATIVFSPRIHCGASR